MKSSLPLVFGLIAPANVLGTVADLIERQCSKKRRRKRLRRFGNVFCAPLWPGAWTQWAAVISRQSEEAFNVETLGRLTGVRR
jgi:hypothetical protein